MTMTAWDTQSGDTPSTVTAAVFAASVGDPPRHSTAPPSLRSYRMRQIAAAPDPLDVIRTVREARFTHGILCLHCRSTAVIRWGGFAGRQRYRCKSCCRTFSDLTRTAFAYTKKVGQWPHYLVLMRRSHTLRQCAQQLDLHVSTAFRWRHAVLTPMRTMDPSVLSGTVELKEILFAHSRKGSRRLYEPRSRGGRKDGWTWQQVPRDRVLLAVSRSGASHCSTVGGDVVVIPAMIEWTRSRLNGRCTVFGTMPRAGACASPIRAAGHDYQLAPVVGDPNPRNSRHTRTVEAFSRRLVTWLGRFRGVASKYRDNYLVWHGRLDADLDLLWARGMIVGCMPSQHFVPARSDQVYRNRPP